MLKSLLNQRLIQNRFSPLLQTCSYAKDKKKDNKITKVVVNDEELTQVVKVDVIRSQMQNVIEQLKQDFVKFLSLRSSAGSIETIKVDLDGEEHTLQELSQIIRSNPKLVVMKFDVFPQVIPIALKALQSSGLNLNPQQDGTTLFIPIPKVTTDHRENLAKNAKALFVKCKGAIRDVQTKHTKQLKNKTSISEDMVRRTERQLVIIGDGYIAEAERLLISKQKELLAKTN